LGRWKKGRESIGYLTHFEVPSVSQDAFQNAFVYMSTQKLRTPKGLGGSKVESARRIETLFCVGCCN